MSIKTVLFDLDGTLLPMDQDVFVETYFSMLAKKLSRHGYDPEELIATVWKGTGVMIKNNGAKTNEAAFWEFFTSHYGEEKARADYPLFDEFYRSEFDAVQSVCGCNPKATEAVGYIKSRGLRVVLATNPLFPSTATEKRIRWAGFTPEDFEIFTTYENSSYCKPHPGYYKEIVEKLGVDPAECLMVGNDVDDDMVVGELGMKVFLLTDCLINKKDVDISVYPHGSFAELIRYVDDVV